MSSALPSFRFSVLPILQRHCHMPFILQCAGGEGMGRAGFLYGPLVSGLACVWQVSKKAVRGAVLVRGDGP